MEKYKRTLKSILTTFNDCKRAKDFDGMIAISNWLVGIQLVMINDSEINTNSAEWKLLHKLSALMTDAIINS